MTGKFENNLWAELEREHAPALTKTLATRRRRRTGRWIGAAAGVAVLAGAAFIAPTYFGGTPPAYAVVDNPDGSVTLTIREVEKAEEATAKLRERGIRAVVVPYGQPCMGRVDGADLPKLVTVDGGMDGADLSFRMDKGVFEMNIVPSRIPEGVTLVLAAQQLDGGSVGVSGGYVRGESPTCLPTR